MCGTVKASAPDLTRWDSRRLARSKISQRQFAKTFRSGTACDDLCAVFHPDQELCVVLGFDRVDEIHVYQVRAVHADETSRVEPLFKIAEREIDQMRLPADMHPRSEEHTSELQ